MDPFLNAPREVKALYDAALGSAIDNGSGRAAAVRKAVRQTQLAGWFRTAQAACLCRSVRSRLSISATRKASSSDCAALRRGSQ